MFEQVDGKKSTQIFYCDSKHKQSHCRTTKFTAVCIVECQYVLLHYFAACTLYFDPINNSNALLPFKQESLSNGIASNQMSMMRMNDINQHGIVYNTINNVGNTNSNEHLNGNENSVFLPMTNHKQENKHIRYTFTYICH